MVLRVSPARRYSDAIHSQGTSQWNEIPATSFTRLMSWVELLEPLGKQQTMDIQGSFEREEIDVALARRMDNSEIERVLRGDGPPVPLGRVLRVRQLLDGAVVAELPTDHCSHRCWARLIASGVMEGDLRLRVLSYNEVTVVMTSLLLTVCVTMAWSAPESCEACAWSMSRGQCRALQVVDQVAWHLAIFSYFLSALWAWVLLIRIGHVPRDEIPAFLMKHCPSEQVATSVGLNAATFMGAGFTTRTLLTRSSWVTVGVYVCAQAVLITALFGGLLFRLPSAISGQKTSLRQVYEFLMGWSIWGWSTRSYTTSGGET